MSSLALSIHVVSSDPWKFIKQQAEKYTSQTMHGVPFELILEIFGFLSPEDLGLASCVCKEWRMLASDQSFLNPRHLQKLFPSLKILDEVVWEKCVDLKKLELNVTGAAPLDQSIMPLLKSLLAPSQIEGEAGVTLLTMPKGLSINKVTELGWTPKQGERIYLNILTSSVSEEMCNISIDKTYRVVITNSILTRSRGLFPDALKELKNKFNKFGCKSSEILPLVTLCVLTYISSNELYPPRLYTDVKETFYHPETGEEFDVLPTTAFSSEKVNNNTLTVSDQPGHHSFAVSSIDIELFARNPCASMAYGISLQKKF